MSKETPTINYINELENRLTDLIKQASFPKDNDLLNNTSIGFARALNVEEEVVLSIYLDMLFLPKQDNFHFIVFSKDSFDKLKEFHNRIS